MQDDGELYGGARRRAPEPPPAQFKAEKFKKQIRENDAEFLDKYMKEAAKETRDGERGTRIDKMLDIVRKTIDKSLREDLGLFLADEVAKTVTKENARDWVQKKNEADRSAKWNASDDTSSGKLRARDKTIKTWRRQYDQGHGSHSRVQ